MELLLSIHTDIMIFRIFFTLGFMLAIDLYAYQAFKTVFRSSATPYVYWGITIAYVIFSITLALMMTSGKVEYRYLGYSWVHPFYLLSRSSLPLARFL